MKANSNTLMKMSTTEGIRHDLGQEHETQRRRREP